MCHLFAEVCHLHLDAVQGSSRSGSAAPTPVELLVAERAQKAAPGSRKKGSAESREKQGSDADTPESSSQVSPTSVLEANKRQQANRTGNGGAASSGGNNRIGGGSEIGCLGFSSSGGSGSGVDLVGRDIVTAAVNSIGMQAALEAKASFAGMPSSLAVEFEQEYAQLMAEDAAREAAESSPPQTAAQTGPTLAAALNALSAGGSQHNAVSEAWQANADKYFSGHMLSGGSTWSPLKCTPWTCLMYPDDFVMDCNSVEEASKGINANAKCAMSEEAWEAAAASRVLPNMDAEHMQQKLICCPLTKVLCLLYAGMCWWHWL